MLSPSQSAHHDKSRMSVVSIVRCGGEHAAVVVDVLLLLNQLEGQVFVWDEKPEGVHCGLKFPSLPESFASSEAVRVFVCHEDGATRVSLAQSVRQRFPNATFPNVIHPRATVSPSCKLGIGLFVGPNAVISGQSVIGDYCVLHTQAVVDHYSVVAEGCSLNPGAIVCCSVQLGRCVTIGASATVRDHVSVGNGCFVGMGACVTQTIRAPAGEEGFWLGIPAKFHLSVATQALEEDRVRWCFKKPFSSDRFLHYLGPSVRAGHVTNDGPLQGVLQAKIQGLVRTKLQVLLCANGTAALHALVAGLALQKGKEALRWVTQAFTFPSSIQGPLQNALVVDNDAQLYGPSLKELEQKKDSFDGVIVTNVFGFQTQVVEYEKWCRENGKLLVLDNAATPIGTLDDGRCIHDIGDGAIISLHETKPLGRGEGGVVILPKECVKFVHRAMNFGFDTSAAVRVPNRQSSNWRMSDIAAAAVCDHLDLIIAENWLQRFESMNALALSKLATRNLSLVYPHPRQSTVFNCLFVKLPDRHMDSDKIAQHLYARGIEAKHYYLPLSDRASCPVAWSVYDHSICLPFHLGISEKCLSSMLDALNDNLGQ